MKNKWVIKLGTPILALAFVGACAPANNDNNDAPQNEEVPDKGNVPDTEENAPENTRSPGNDNTPNKNETVPDNEGYENPNTDPNKDNMQNKLDLRHRR